jgi:hypothetical protein
MSGSLYDEDILAWSEQQAAALRRLASDPGRLPNELDLEHVIEEIEDVGQSQRNAVESYARQIYVHLIKLASQPDAPAAKHWRAEIVAFHNDLTSRVTPSMRNRLDLDVAWRRALREAQARLEAADCESDTNPVFAKLAGPPLDFDELSRDDLDVNAVLSRWPLQG